MRAWDDSILDGLPDSLLRWFACVCAQRSLKRAEKDGKEPDPRSWNAVKVARQFVLGNATEEDLDDSPYHITGDASVAIGRGWDLVIDHPPCTYL